MEHKDHLTSLIAFIAVLVAFFQWWTADQKRRLELFERRLDFYKRCAQLVGDASSGTPIPNDDYGLAGSTWLFGPEVSSWIRELVQLEHNYRCELKILEDFRTDPSWQTRLKDQERDAKSALAKLHNHYRGIDVVFDPYMHVADGLLTRSKRWLAKIPHVFDSAGPR